MKKITPFVLLFIFVLTLVGCSQTSKSATSVLQDYLAAMNAHDIDKTLSYLADDAYVCCDLRTGKLLQGHDNIRAVLQDIWSRIPNISYVVSDISEKNGEVRYSYELKDGDTTLESGTDGLTIVKDGMIIFDGVESLKPK